MSPRPGRVLAIDPGRVRIGLALSDPLGIVAQGLPTLRSAGRAKDMGTLANLVFEKEVAEIVVGCPMNLDRTESAMSVFAKRLAAGLAERTGLVVRLWDEAFTSAEAERVMLEGGARRETRKARRDQLAAILILQAYLDWRSAQDSV